MQVLKILLRARSLVLSKLSTFYKRVQKFLRNYLLPVSRRYRGDRTRLAKILRCLWATDDIYGRSKSSYGNMCLQIFTGKQ